MMGTGKVTTGSRSVCSMGETLWKAAKEADRRSLIDTRQVMQAEIDAARSAFREGRLSSSRAYRFACYRFAASHVARAQGYSTSFWQRMRARPAASPTA